MRAILTYHSVDPSGSAVSLDAETFQRHVRWLVGGTVRVATLPGLLAMPPESNAVALTFDDGFTNFATAAWPLLRDHGLPVTLFVVVDHVGCTNTWSGGRTSAVPTLPLLAWDALARLAAEGVTLGSHSRTHARLTALSADQLEGEVQGSAERLRAATGARPNAFAYPYGNVDGTVERVVSANYRWACTTVLRTLRACERPHLLPRLDMYYFRAARRLESWGTAAFWRYLWLRSQARWLRETLPSLGAVR
jgi:peptidoglycan/xylan/chitin deacetylase (PgdA/CDA1 family)